MRLIPRHRTGIFVRSDPDGSGDWCLIHFPFGGLKNGADSDKAFQDHYIQLIQSLFSAGTSLDLTGAKLEGPLLRRWRKPISIVLDHAEVRGQLDFPGPIQEISARSLTSDSTVTLAVPVSGNADFDGAHISGSLLVGVVHGNFSAESSRIDGNLTVDQSGSQQNSSINLSAAIVKGSAKISTKGQGESFRMSEASVGGDLEIDARGSSEFSADGLNVGGTANILGGRDETSINEAQFHTSTTINAQGIGFDAKGCEFRGITNLKGFTVDSVDLSNSIFHETFLLAGGDLGINLCCDGSEFRGNADFTDTSALLGSFRGAKFLKDAWFRGVSFGSEADFTGVVSTGIIDLASKSYRSSQSSNGVDESAATMSTLIFDGAQLESVSLAGRRFEAPVSFLNASFGRAPIVFGCEFKEAIAFPLSLKNYKDRRVGARANYRVLKQKMEEVRARPEQALFFALEQYCARDELGLVGRFVSYFYAQTSRYGWSIGLPLFYLLIWSSLFALIFGQLTVGSFQPPTSIDVDAVAAGVRVSLQNTFMPFFAIRDDGNSLTTVALSILQSLFSVALIAEALLALRWRFRRG